MSVDDGYRRMMLILGQKGDKQEPAAEPYQEYMARQPREPVEDVVAYPPLPGPANNYGAIAAGIAKTVEVKNEKYGDSYHQSGDFLRLLYPSGVKPEQYGDMLATARIFDKLKRIATDRDALGESPYHDIAGYCLLALDGRKK